MPSIVPEKKHQLQYLSWYFGRTKPIINTEGIVNRIRAQNQGIKGVEMKESSQIRIELMEKDDIG